MRIRFQIFKENIKRSFWKKVFRFSMKKSFYWWDYSYFFEMNYEWLKYASKNFEEKGHTVNNKKVARRMLIASEICKRIADDYITDNVYTVVFGSDYISKPFSFDRSKKLSDEERNLFKKKMEFEKKLYLYYLNYLSEIIRKYSLTWWD